MNIKPAPAPAAAVPEGPTVLARLRERLLDQLLGLLEADC